MTLLATLVLRTPPQRLGLSRAAMSVAGRTVLQSKGFAGDAVAIKRAFVRILGLVAPIRADVWTDDRGHSWYFVVGTLQVHLVWTGSGWQWGGS